MDILLSLNIWLAALLIFSLRVIDMSLDTLRVLFVVRGRKGIVWILGFIKAGVFVIAIGTVLKNLNNPLNIIGYAAGFATGNVVGMLIEERIAIGNIYMRIVSPRRGSAIAERLREEGFAITEVPARGKDGMVTMLDCGVRRRQVKQVKAIVDEIDQKAFITAEDIRPVWRGYWRP